MEISSFLELVIDKAKSRTKFLIGHANIRGLNFAYSERKFRDFYQLCDIVTSDGFGPIVGAKILRQEVKPGSRFTCPDYIDTLLSVVEERELSIYFLAGAQEVIDRLNQILKEKYPNLKYRAQNGYFKKEGDENKKTLESIRNFSPDILYVGFGMPVQEYWILENYEDIDAKVILPLGACLDFYTGMTYRGPKWLTDSGFEWLTRLVTQPTKLWRRYIVGNPLFFMRLIVSRFKKS